MSFYALIVILCPGQLFTTLGTHALYRVFVSYLILFSAHLKEIVIRAGNYSTFNNEIILSGTKVVLPTSLQNRAVMIAHKGHQRESKTISLLREHVWFPHLTKLVRDVVHRCIPCQASARPSAPEPLSSTEMPEQPWTELKIDFCGPLGTVYTGCHRLLFTVSRSRND